MFLRLTLSAHYGQRLQSTVTVVPSRDAKPDLLLTDHPNGGSFSLGTTAVVGLRLQVTPLTISEVTMHITQCPPMSAAQYEHFDRCSFDNRRRQPVSATYERLANGELGATSPGLSFSDFRRMAVDVHKRGKWSRQAPLWVFATEKVRFVICCALEGRAGILRPPVDLPLEKRFALAQQRLLTRRVPLLEQQIDSLCAEYVRVKKSNPEYREYLRLLEIEIENADTQLRIASRAAAVLVGCLYFAWHVGLDSVGVAIELGIKPPHARRILGHLNRIAREQHWE